QRAVILLGGHAFARPGEALTMAGQFKFAYQALRPLEPLLCSDAEIVITHGNGPQVGHILTRVEEALGKAYAIPLEVCVAESEGELGYVLVQTLFNLLSEGQCDREIVALLTQVVVDAADPAFEQPTKPIGPFYDKAEAEALMRQGFALREDAGRGYRRVVASPEPKEILEIDVIEQLLGRGVLTIAAGGGGIPVVRSNGLLRGVEAVVDKDLASALLGQAVGAGMMLMLTDVPCAYRHFGTPQQTPIGRITVEETRQLQSKGHFAVGSMGPKIEAAIRFCGRPGTRAIICDPASLPGALQGEAGTIVTG
ncbi:MAG: carbamate kinase, partial [Planctomycetota bacterium]